MLNPAANPGLVEDCLTLLELRDALTGDGALNWSEDVPLRLWEGITLGDSPHRVVSVRLVRKGLNGVVPSEFGKLSGLRTLKLNLNELSGAIPPELGNLEKLNVLDLSRNSLSGEIPSKLGESRNLSELLLANNMLTGEFPEQLKSLWSLATMTLYGNELHGCIPEELRRVSGYWGQLTNCSITRSDRPERPEPVWSERSTFTERPVLKGGIDLGVTYIERLPRYQRYRLAYFEHGECRYPYNQFKGAVVCPSQQGIKRWPDPGDPIELIAYVWNFGNRPSGPFDYEWKLNDETLEAGRHGGLESGKYAEFTLLTEWPGDESNPTVTFAVDTQNEIEELIENNNTVVDGIKGYTLGFYFSSEAYEALSLSTRVGTKFQSPEHWIHQNIARMNEMFTEYGLKDRVRAELFFITEDRYLNLNHELRWYMDGWWHLWHEDPVYAPIAEHLDPWRYTERKDIDYVLLHELMHQLGVIDLYRLEMHTRNVLLPDANNPGKMAGCGKDYWPHEDVCYWLPEETRDLMVAYWEPYNFIGAHTAGGLKKNSGYRRGYYGEYLYDTPETTVLRIVDQTGKSLPSVALRFYQYEYESGKGHVLDAVPEFELTTDASGSVVLPNRGITGIVTETGHQLKPNPFGGDRRRRMERDIPH